MLNAFKKVHVAIVGLPSWFAIGFVSCNECACVSVVVGRSTKKISGMSQRPPPPPQPRTDFFFNFKILEIFRWIWNLRLMLGLSSCTHVQLKLMLHLIFFCSSSTGGRRMATGLAVLRRPLMNNLPKDPHRSPLRSPGPGPGHLPSSPGRHRGNPSASPGALPLSPGHLRRTPPVSPGPLQPPRTLPVSSSGPLQKTSPLDLSLNIAKKRRASQESTYGKKIKVHLHVPS